MRRGTTLLFCLVVLFPGGDAVGAQSRVSLKAELANVREERDMLKAKVENMWANFNRERDQWLDQNFELKSELENLRDTEREKSRLASALNHQKERYQQLERWAKALTNGYGPGIWEYSQDHLRPLYDREPREATVSGILNELNDVHREAGHPLLLLQKVEDGVVFLGTGQHPISITQLAHSQATDYLQSALYSVTSLGDVECVYFDIHEGDYVAPGKFCK